MIIPYLDSYIMYVGLWFPIVLVSFFVCEDLLEVYIQNITVVICEDHLCVVLMIGRSELQLGNKSWVI